MRKTFAEAYPRQLLLAKRLSDAGVRMLAGSDGGCMMGPGITLQEEFVELGKAGIAPLKVLQMTTINAAEYLGRTSTMGSVEPGRNADLVLLDADPLERVENLAAIAGVVRAGKYFSRQDLDSLKERVAKGRGYL
jgi:imidazolonepropionase-like amidohydrolase